MAVRMIGMIGVSPPRSNATLHVIEGALSPNYVAEAAHTARGSRSIWCWWATHRHPPKAFWSRFMPPRIPSASDIWSDTWAGFVRRR